MQCTQGGEGPLGLDIAKGPWGRAVLLGQRHHLQAVEGILAHANVLEGVVQSRALASHAGHCPGHFLRIETKVLQQNLPLFQRHAHASSVLGTFAAREA